MLGASAIAGRPRPSLASPAADTQLVRSSSLLVLGRIIGQAVEFLLQIFFVRYLSQGDFGALGYALAIVVLFRTAALFELPLTLARYVPVFRASRRDDAVLGSIVLGIGIVAGLGTLVALAVDVAVLGLGITPTDDPRALLLLVVLSALIPIDALDVLLTSLFAAFAGPKAIFVRQAVLGPGLRIGLVLAVIAVHASVVVLAVGYLIVGVVSLAAYSWMFARLLVRQMPLSGMRLRRLHYPAGELLRFAAPLLASTLVWLLMESSDAVLLGYFRGSEEVAAFRAVLVVALLNQGVTFTFALFYTPSLSRLYAEGHRHAIRDLYWRSTLWVTLLSFPVFLLTCSFAPSVTAGVLGDRYAGAAPIMALLALGFFFHAALGFNGLTLRVFKKLRYCVLVDLAAALLNVVLVLVLIPRWGVYGAAVGTSATMVAHNVLKQVGLWWHTGIPPFERAYARIYLALIVVALGLATLQSLLPAGLPLAVLLSSTAGIGLLWWARTPLQIERMFPELARLPFVRMLATPARS
jgi:O-antigen/teichoic acid export membrane protein